MTAEHTRPGRRGRATSAVSMGAPTGSVLATGTMALFSFVLLGLGIYLRYRVSESPVFLAAREQGARQAGGTPIVTLLKRNPRQVLWGIAMAVGPFAGQGVLFIYIASYATSIGDGRSQALLAITHLNPAWSVQYRRFLANSSQVDAMIACLGQGVRNLTRLPASNSGANSQPPSADQGVVEPVSQAQASRGARGSAADVEGSRSKLGRNELPGVPRQTLAVAESSGRRRGRKSCSATEEHSLMVRVPDELPSLTVSVSRILLAILVELTTVDVIEVSPQGGRYDR